MAKPINIAFPTTSFLSRGYTSYGNPWTDTSGMVSSGSFEDFSAPAETPDFGKPGVVLQPLPYVRQKKEVKFWKGRRHEYTPNQKVGTRNYRESLSDGPLEPNGTEQFLSTSLPASDLASAMDKANTKLLTKVKATSVNLAVAYAERNRTAQMVAKTATDLASALHNLRQGDFMGAARDLGIAAKKVPKKKQDRFKREYTRNRAKALSSGWLELQYGWKPLLSDVYGAAEELAKKQASPHTETVMVQHRVSQEVNYTSRYGSADDMKIISRFSGSRLLIVRKSVTIYRKPGAPQDLFRLGILNPLVVAWELVPYSFVVDWFLPLGAWLETFDAHQGIEFLGGYQTVFERSSIKGERAMSGTIDDSVLTGSAVASTEYINMNRTILRDLPPVGLPRLKDPRSVGHAANAIALLTQMFGRK